MNDKVGLLSYRMEEGVEKPYSNETAQLVDTEARLLVSHAYASTVALVQEKRDLIESMATMLLEKEVRQGDKWRQQRLVLSWAVVVLNFSHPCVSHVKSCCCILLFVSCLNSPIILCAGWID